MKLVLASNNKNKLREVKQLLEPLGFEILSQGDANVDVEPDENGKTFAENAAIKARAVYNICKMPVIADDSGLCVDYLNGDPGVFSARYAPENQLCDKLIAELDGVNTQNRSAHFACVICYIDKNAKEHFFEGKVFGTIGFEKKGTNGFGYDPVFVYKNGKTLAQMDSDEKNMISHRANALKALVEYFENGNN